MQIVLTVDKGKVAAQKQILYSYMNFANRVHPDSKVAVIREAEKSIHKAKAIFETLSSLELLEDFHITQEDINRTEQKIADILDERRRKELIRRH